MKEKIQKLNDQAYWLEFTWNHDHDCADGVYHAPTYSFKFKDPAIQNTTWTVIRPSHLKVLRNDSELSTADLKKLMIADWFEQENLVRRHHNNQKAQERRAKRKMQVN